ncbi:MAG: Tll0287-like domain-containing protein [Candidatus Cyclobacteriaceae bacterium M3_2C_046]
MNYKRFFYLAFGFIVLACEPPPQNQENKALTEEIQSREIRKIEEGDIINEALKVGNQIADTTQKTLAGNLVNAIQDQGIRGAIQFCNLAAYPLVDSLQKKLNVQIKRTSLQTRNPDNQPTSLEKQLLEAYHYNAENNLALEPAIQEIDEAYLLFAKPIVIGNPLCLNCHGEVGKQVQSENYQIIKGLYPEDQATGYQEGDLRGMWSIKIPKNEIIKNL